MTNWFTADLHLGHRNIIEYCARPFADVDEMDRALIGGWNRVVDPHDTVWVVGDFALGQIAETLPRARELNGRTILVTGNHDRCWFGHGDRADPWVERYRDAGFDEIVQGSTHVRIGDRDVLVCHFPYRGDSHDEDRFIPFRPVDEGEWLIHGHVHERWTQDGRMINVGVDVRGFAPVSEAELDQVIRTGDRARDEASSAASSASSSTHSSRSPG